MGKTYAHMRKWKLKQVLQDYREMDYTEVHSSKKGAEILKEWDSAITSGTSSWQRKYASKLKIRHRSKEALRSGDETRLYRKWNGKRNIKTGYDNRRKRRAKRGYS